MSKLYCMFLTILAFLTVQTTGSIGDRSQHYNGCLIKCYNDNCSTDMEFEREPAVALRLLMWSCKDDCGYHCMWKTVEYFAAQGKQVPQFHGKWPFKRIMGLQEPASVFFSLLNFLVHLTMYKKFKKEVRSQSPMSLTWTYFSVVCLNGWVWSTIFHARDKPFTEVMDYSCAFAILLTSLYCMTIRVTYKSYKGFAALTCGYISILYAHLSHLWSGKINYGYNMKFNIALGFLTFFITMIWWYRNRKKLTHAPLIGWFNILTVSVTLLEVADFSPIFWTFDAHSLWHASTAPLAILLYRFMILDCKYLRKVYTKSVLDAE